jgi:hypothetical protein
MLKNKIKISFMLVLVTMFVTQLSAQNQLSSPYSRFGMGEMAKRMSSTNIAMGDVAYAYQSPVAVNVANPASYIAFDSLSCLIDAAFSLNIISCKKSYKQNGSTISFNYLSLGFSVLRNWKTVLGFQPYSFINYTINQYTPFDDTSDIHYAYNGTGGVYEFYWGNAFRLFKNFSIGLNMSYLFGNYNKLQIVEFPIDKFFYVKRDNELQINGALFSFGTQYFIPIKKSFIGLGLVYTPSIPTVYGNKPPIC